MVEIAQMDSYMSEKNAKIGDLVEICGDATIELKEDQFGKRKIMNIPVKLNGNDLTWSPGKIARDILAKIFESTNTSNWIGKKFQVDYVKMTVKGQLKDIIIPKKI